MTPLSDEAFERLYRSMLPTVYRYATSRLGRTEGEEVASEVFVAAAVAVRDGRRAQVTEAWLMAVTKNKVIDRWRRAERRMARAHLLFDRGADAADDDTAWGGADDKRVLDVLERLSARHRRLLVSHYVDGLSAPEIAELFDMSTAAIESALARARNAFKNRWEKVSS